MSKRRSRFVLDTKDPKLATAVRDILEENCPTTWVYEPQAPAPYQKCVPKFVFEVKNNTEIWGRPNKSYLYLNPICELAKGILAGLVARV